MKYYALAKEISQVYGHGDSSREYHICPKNAYMGDMSFHPIFKDREAAEDYMNRLSFTDRYAMEIIELSLYEDK